MQVHASEQSYILHLIQENVYKIYHSEAAQWLVEFTTTLNHVFESQADIKDQLNQLCE